MARLFVIMAQPAENKPFASQRADTMCVNIDFKFLWWFSFLLSKVHDFLKASSNSGIFHKNNNNQL